MPSRFLFLYAFILFLWLNVANGWAQRVQIIHNAADPALAVVDVWTQGATTPLLTNFNFRQATDYLFLNPGNYTFQLKAPGSSQTSPTLFSSTPIALTAADTNIIFINGVSGSGFAPNPSGANTALKFQKLNGKIGANAGSFAYGVYHGSTDVAAVDLVDLTAPASPNFLLFDLSYSQAKPFQEITTANFRLGLAQSGSSLLKGLYTAALPALGADGLSGVVFASGFDSPSQNNNGAAFGLFVALQNGSVLALPQESAKIQIIHNAAETALDTLDVEISLGDFQISLIEDFAFRTATPYFAVPSGINLNIKLFEANVSTPISAFPVNLDQDGAYLAVATGVTGSGFAPNPDGQSIAFQLSLHAGQIGAPDGNFALNVFQGVSDLAKIDVANLTDPTNPLAFASQLGFRNESGYQILMLEDYHFGYTAANTLLLEGVYSAPVSELGGNGMSGVLLSSGFDSPANNNNGAALKWFLVFENGFVIELEQRTARLQIIQNTADPALSSFDLEIGFGAYQLAKLSGLSYPSATPFLTLPSELAIQLTVLAAGSTTVFKEFSINMNYQEEYTSFISGVLNPGQFNIGTNGNNIALNFYYYSPTKNQPPSDTVQTFFFHGSTDTPTLDFLVYEPGQTTAFDTLSAIGYGASSGIFRLWPMQNLQLTLAAASSPNQLLYSAVAPFLDSLSGGQTLTLFTSGFIDPRYNQNGAAFQIYVALSNGAVYPLIERTARLQILHNSPDPSLNNVDVLIMSGVRLVARYQGLSFRQATAYVPVPANLNLETSIYANGSTTPTAFKHFSLEAEKEYTVAASGVVNPTGYNKAYNANIALALSLGETFSQASNANNTKISFFHGVTDAPALDLLAADGVTPVQEIADVGFSFYSNSGFEYNALDQILTFTSSSVNTQKLVSVKVPFQSQNAGGQGWTLFASGFFDPETNQNGVSFKFFALLPDGTVLPLEEPTTRIQFVHNSPDPLLISVDLVLKSGPRLIRKTENFYYRSATPFFDAPLGIDITSALQLGGANIALQALGSLQDKKYLIVYQGVLADSLFEKPNGRDISLTLLLFDNAQEEAEEADKFDGFFVHGSTDAPAFDLFTRNVPTPIVANLNYNQGVGYLSFEPQSFIFDLKLNGDTAIKTSYKADFSSIQGQAAVVFASGLYTPEGDPAGGQPFGLFAAFPDGFVAALPATSGPVSVEENLATLPVRVYPNPASRQFQIAFELKAQENLTLTLHDLQGKTVKTVVLGQSVIGKNQFQIDITDLCSGFYVYRLTGENSTATGKIVVSQ